MITHERRATDLGATDVKVFPASRWRPQVLADAFRALPSLRCMPTGAVPLDDVQARLAASAVAVGPGSAQADGSPWAVARVIEAVSLAPGNGVP